MATQTLTRPNRYPAACIRCSGHIPANAGLLARDTTTGKWAADHDGDCPPKPSVLAVPVKRVTGPGVFQLTDGTIYRVQTSRGSDRLYAKVWTPDTDTFEYAAGAVHTLTEDDRMTAEQAAAFGHAHACCVYCSRSLSDPRSEQVGYGAICAAKNGLPWG